MNQAKDFYSDEYSSQEDNLIKNQDEIPTADEIDDHHGGGPANSASVFGASLNLFKSLVGIGILALPNAFSQSGWLAGIILLPICAAGMLYLSHELMAVAEKRQTHARNLVHFTKETAPRLHVILVNVCLLIFQTGACISYVIFSLKYIQKSLCNLNEDNFACSSKFVAIIISLTFLVPLMMIKDMSKLRFGSMVGNVVVLISLATVTVYCLIFLSQDGVGEVDVINPTSMGSSIGVFIFAFEGVGVYFNIRNSMKQPSKFGSVLNYSITVAISLYCLIGLLGYLTFGKDVNDIILFSFREDNIPMQIIQFIYCISLIFTYPVQIFPCVNVIEIKVRQKIYGNSNNLKVKSNDNTSSDENQASNISGNINQVQNGASSENSFITEEQKKKQNLKYQIGSVLVRLGFIFLTFLVAITFDNISDFLSITGDICGIYLCYVIPVVIIHYQQKEYPLYKKILNFSIMIISIGFGIYGLYSTSLKIKDDFF